MPALLVAVEVDPARTAEEVRRDGGLRGESVLVHGSQYEARAPAVRECDA
jgi:hypothetical protein